MAEERELRKAFNEVKLPQVFTLIDEWGEADLKILKNYDDELMKSLMDSIQK